MIVAVEPSELGVTVYHRDGNRVWSEEEEYNPWLLVPTEGYHFLNKKKFTPLVGTGYYNRLIEYPSWRLFYESRRLAYDAGEPTLAYGSAAKQYLMRTGRRMFEGAGFDDALRLTFDIEATGLDPATSEVILIAMLTNRGDEYVLVGDEKDILHSFRDLVGSIDPDVIEGHNSLGYDLPFIASRYERHNLVPRLGRGETPLKIGRIRKLMIGPNEKWFSPVYIPGRHVVDTYLEVQKYDVAAQKLTSYGLKAVARDFGIAEEDRIELPREKIAQLWKVRPDVVTTYALQDVRETKRLAEIVFPVEFMQTSLVPDGFIGVCTTGNGEKWNSILVAEYLRRGISIPQRQYPEPYIGARVECRRTGIINRVVKADVESLYPSLMLTRNIKPAADTENVMLPLLAKLKEERLSAKRKAKESLTQAERDYWQGYNESAKILINSAYGFLGAPVHFGDWTAAERVTVGGREIVESIANELERRSASVIELDTDGVMFVPPVHVVSSEDEADFVREVGAILPEGIHLAHDGRYKTMLSLRMKNYVLLDYDGKITYKGASLKNRGMEPFLSAFLKQAIGRLFDADLDSLLNDYLELCSRIFRRQVAVSDLTRRERITEKTRSSPARRRLSAASEGAAVGEYVWVYEREDGTLGTAEDYANDENVLYYMLKLWKVVERLADVIPNFETLYPKPGKRWLKSYEQQAT